MSAISDEQLYGAEHVVAYRETGGRRGFRWKRGTTILLLTTEGRSSGIPRTMPLIFREDGDRWVIVASNGGTRDHPAWFKNLQHNPGATIQVRDEHIPVQTRVAEGDERGRLWKLMAEVWPPYEDYQRKTDREIPVVVLERRD